MGEYKKLFVVSDIHGHYTLMRLALKEAGFDENNAEHLFVSCGDLFDRGKENRKVYDYVRKLKNKVLVKGNHDARLVEIIQCRQADIYDLHNGTVRTLEEFFGKYAVGEFGQLYLPEHGKMAGKLCRFVGEMVNYFETEHYVFVHGWLPTVRDADPPQLLENWREADEKAWRTARFSEWMSYYRTPAMLQGKTIVCGHRPTRLSVKVDPMRSPTDSSMYVGEGMIAIDAGTVRSGRVNVLVLEERA